MRDLIVVALLSLTALQMGAQQIPPDLNTIPDSIKFIWKDIERDFVSLAEAMPAENGASGRPTASSGKLGLSPNK